MWKLSGEDIERAKEELKERRAAVRARYEAEVKQLDAKIVEIEAFERAARAFVLDFKSGSAPDPAVSDLAAQPVAVTEPSEAFAAAANASPTEEEGNTADPAEAAPVLQTERGRSENRASRWRMRLNTAETSA